MGLIYETHRWDGLRWDDMHTKFHEDWLGHSSNIKVITSTVWEAVVLALLLRGIYYILRWHGFRWRDLHTNLHYDRLRHLSNITVITANVWETVMLVLLIEGTYGVRHWDDFMWYGIPSFMKIGTGVQAVLRFSLINVRGCNVGITDGRDLWITPTGSDIRNLIRGGDAHPDTQRARWSQKPTFIFSK
jgi:hypothetical protein